jgi:sulfite dehydrogenase (quinone) subunit SoeB
MRLGLAIDLDTCVGCHACAVACKEWNGASLMGGAPDYDAYGKAPSGVWYNRIRHYEIEGDPSFSPKGCASEAHQPLSKTMNVPMSCMHCEEAHCVTVCPTGASYKRAEDGIVLVDPNRCMGCNYCAWACPYGARELDEDKGVMRKCTLCVDRIYDQQLPEEERQPACVLACPTHARHFGDYDNPQSNVSRLAASRGRQSMLDELGYMPANAYLSPRKPVEIESALPVRAGLSEKARAFINRLIQL